MRPRISLALCVALALALPATARAPRKEAAADPLIREVALSLEASAVAPPPPERMALAGLEALRADDPCFRAPKNQREVLLLCEGRKRRMPWPPEDGRAVASLLSEAARLLDGKGEVRQDRAQRIARALAAAADDPYTAYLSPQLVRKLEGATTLATSGIELLPSVPSEIREVRPGSDAAREGLREGDHILEIDGVATRAFTLAELSAMLMGRPGTVLRLVVAPRDGGRRTLVVARSLIPEPAVDSDRLPGGALYLRVSTFAPGVAREVTETLWAERPSGIVLDLRHNQGGLLREGVALLDLFFSEGSIGGVKPRPGRPADSFEARHQPTDLVDTPLVVLIDGGSASASELVAMVLKERGRATVLGSPSIGKGSVQKVIRLPDGGVLRVTSAHYTGPQGNRLPPDGVHPHRYLAPPVGRTVLEGGAPRHDSWVLAALDVLEGTAKVSGSARRDGLLGPMP